MIKKTIEYIRIPKKLFISLVVIIFLALIVYFLKPQVMLVDITEVRKGVFQKTIVDEAVTSFKDKHILTAPADGMVSNVDFEAGDAIKKGQVLINFEWDKDIKIRAPFDGFILRIFEKDRRHVHRGTRLLEVGSPKQIEVIAQLLSEEVIGARVGQKAILTTWGKEEPLEAIVRKIEPSAQEEVSALGVKEQKVKVHLDISSDKSIWEGLGDGYRLEVAIVVRETPEAKLIPVGALFSNQGRPAVFLVKDKKLEIKDLEIIDRNQNFAEVKSDLPIGSELVLYPGSSLKEGDKVKVRLRK